MRAPRARAPVVRCRTDRSPFLRAVPAAKERGDRGRGTSAFEMVLSPGAGRASAAGVQPPCGHHSGKVSRQPAGQAAQRAPTPQVQPVPPPALARGCKGRSPLHKKTKNLPLPRRGRGAGGWGQETKLKAGQAGGKEGKPPLRIPERQGQPATNRASPPKITPAPAARGKQSQNRAR